MSCFYDEKPWCRTYPEWFTPDLSKPPETVLSKFIAAADRHPEAPCIYYFDTCYSYSDTRQMATALASALSAKGVQSGDRILFVLQNIPQAVIGAIAVWMLQAINSRDCASDGGLEKVTRRVP